MVCRKFRKCTILRIYLAILSERLTALPNHTGMPNILVFPPTGMLGMICTIHQSDIGFMGMTMSCHDANKSY